MNAPETQHTDGRNQAIASFAYFLAFILIVPIVILVWERVKPDAFVRFAATQGTAIALIMWLLGTVYRITAETIPILGLLVLMPVMLINLLLFVYCIYLGLMTLQGKEVEVPLLGDFIRHNFLHR